MLTEAGAEPVRRFSRPSVAPGLPTRRVSLRRPFPADYGQFIRLLIISSWRKENN